MAVRSARSRQQFRTAEVQHQRVSELRRIHRAETGLGGFNMSRDPIPRRHTAGKGGCLKMTSAEPPRVQLTGPQWQGRWRTLYGTKLAEIN